MIKYIFCETEKLDSYHYLHVIQEIIGNTYRYKLIENAVLIKNSYRLLMIRRVWKQLFNYFLYLLSLLQNQTKPFQTKPTSNHWRDLMRLLSMQQSNTQWKLFHSLLLMPGEICTTHFPNVIPKECFSVFMSSDGLIPCSEQTVIVF